MGRLIAVHALIAMFAWASADAQTLPERPTSTDGNGVTVPGRVERPLTPPRGDARSWYQRFRDRSAFDRCVMKAANSEQETGGYPVAATPEELCAQSLGMRDRNAPPAWRDRSPR
jgi:hypothetical protein